MNPDLALDGAPLQQQIATQVQQSGTSFYAAMRLLPQARRDAMFAIYAFCRTVDDIADEPAELEEKRAELQSWREEIDKLYNGSPIEHPIAKALAPHIAAFALRREDFMAVIDGMAMDAEGDIVAPTLAELDLYCDRVASAVGRLSVRAFGATEPEADEVAHHLGRALQLTNILRDLAEDADRGRLYLPRELLNKHGLVDVAPHEVVKRPELRGVCRELAEKARTHFHQACEAMRSCARGPMRPARLMGGYYRAILDRLVADDWQQPLQRVSLSKLKKFWLILRHGIF